MLRAEGKLPVTTLNVVDWPDITVADWEERVRDFVRVVPSRIIEIGNEPGTYVPEGQVQAVWDAYFLRLKKASPIVRGAGKKVILGGNPPGGQAFPGAQEFFRQANLANIWPWVDGVGLHPYMETPVKQLQYIQDRREQLKGYGFTGPHSAFYLEFGWGTGGPPPMNVGEAVQAQYLRNAFTNIRNGSEPEDLNIAIAWWFTWKDWGDGSKWVHYAGVRRSNGTEKPSYCALRDIANAPPTPTCP
jgi:hypothetical protein